MAKTIEQTYQKLTDIEHCLKRPGMYIGSTNFHKSRSYLLDGSKFKLYNVTFNPGFVQLFEEIISNAVDEHVRNGTINKIDITVNEDHIIVQDNGGIPVEKHKDHGMYVPELIFSNLKAGSNFDDDESRLVAGTHGVGATITNIFSTKFIVETADGKKSFKQVFTNNMHDRTKPVIKKATRSYTKITFYPDFERFKMKKIDEISQDVMRKRITDYAACNPRLRISLNKEVYKYSKFRDYCDLYINEGSVLYEESKHWKIGVGHSHDGYQQVSFVNSIETKDGGTHVDYIRNQIISALREMIKKKYKIDVKPSDLRNHMFLFINADIVNSSFSSQTKDKLITESRNFGSEYQVSEKLIKDIFKSEILQSVLDWVDKKKLAEERRQERLLNKNVSRIKVLKLIDAKKNGSRENCILGIYEGLSALSAVREHRNPQVMGAFPLKGKFINVSELTKAKVMTNEEVKNLMASIGLKLGQEPLNLRYGKIYIYTDADPDGDAISGALINFFAKYWPRLFDDGRIYKVMTPLVVAKNGKSKKSFYTNDEYNKWEAVQKNLKKWDIEYKKGLASLESDEYSEIINNPYVIKITKDKKYADTLSAWFAGNSEKRKEKILGKPMEYENSIF